MTNPRHTDAMEGTGGEHQMTVDECIEVAERNLDGKSFPADGRAAAQGGRGRAMAPDDPPHLSTPCLSPAEAARRYLANRHKGDQ